MLDRICARSTDSLGRESAAYLLNRLHKFKAALPELLILFLRASLVLLDPFLVGGDLREHAHDIRAQVKIVNAARGHPLCRHIRVDDDAES